MNIMIANFCNLISLHYICGALLESRNFKKQKHYFTFSIMFTIICLINMKGASTQKSLVIFIVYILYISFQFKINCFNILCAVIPFYVFSLLSELIIGVILHCFLGFHQFTKMNSLIYNIGLLSSVLLLLLFSYLFVKFIKYLKLNSFPNYHILIFAFPLATIFFIATLNSYFSLINNTSTMLLIFFSILLSNFTILTIFFLVIRSNKISSDLELLLYRENIVNAKYNLLKNHYNNNFFFLHNLLHQCYQLKTYVDEDNKEDVKKELRKMTDTTFKKFNSIYTNSLALNYAVNSKLKELEKNGIHFISTIKYNDFSFLTLELQTEIFSKILDYGIILNQSVPEKERNIIIKSQKFGQQIIISSLIKFKNNELVDIKKEIETDFKYILHNIQNYNVSVKIKNNSCISIIIYFNQTE